MPLFTSAKLETRIQCERLFKLLLAQGLARGDAITERQIFVRFKLDGLISAPDDVGISQMFYRCRKCTFIVQIDAFVQGGLGWRIRLDPRA